MGIWDRAKNIAKSYISDGVDKIADKIDDFLDSDGDAPDKLSDEEMEEILRGAGYYSNQADPRKQADLKKAYDRLGVLQGMTLDQIEKAYKKEMIKYHPDKFGDSSKKEMATKVSQELGEAIAIIRKELKNKDK